MADREMLQKGLQVAWERLKKDKMFVAGNLVEYLEPVFEQAGYRKPRAKGDRRRILVIRDDAAGDFVLFSPFLRELRRLYPRAEITLLGSPRNRELAVHCPYVDRFLENPYEAGEFADGFIKMMKLGLELAGYEFDLAFAPRLGIKSMTILLLYLCGAKERVAFTQDRVNPAGELIPVGWDGLLTVAVPFPSQPEVHSYDTDCSLMLLEALLRLPIADRHLEVWYTRGELEKVRRLVNFQKLCAVVPGASMAMKQWPVERYVAVCREIAARSPSVSFLVLGGPDDKAVAAEFAAAFPGRALSLAGELTYSESAAAMSMCGLYIGNDTGLMHVAAALGKPVLSVNCFPLSLPMMAMSSPVRFRPYGVPCVTVFPAEPRDDCADSWEHGCRRENEAHCILGVEAAAVIRGYELLLEEITQGRQRAVFIK